MFHKGLNKEVLIEASKELIEESYRLAIQCVIDGLNKEAA